MVASTSHVAHTAALGQVTAANSESTGPGPGMCPLAASGAQTREEVPGGGPGRAALFGPFISVTLGIAVIPVKTSAVA